MASPEPESIVGQRFGRLVVIERAKALPGDKGAHWRCRCDCGRTCVAKGTRLKVGRVVSCGCRRRDQSHKDRAGTKYGQLTCIRMVGRTPHGPLWECACACGGAILLTSHQLSGGRRSCNACGAKVREVRNGERFGYLTATESAIGCRTKASFLCDCGKSKRISLSHVVFGRTVSCGCVARFSNIKSGMLGHRHKSQLYSYWQKLRRRTDQPVSHAWRSSFAAFVADIGERPSRAHRLQKLTHAGGYVPGNVEWRAPKTKKGDAF